MPLRFTSNYGRNSRARETAATQLLLQPYCTCRNRLFLSPESLRDPWISRTFERQQQWDNAGDIHHHFLHTDSPDEMETFEFTASTLEEMEVVVLAAEATADAMSPAKAADSRLPAGQASSRPSGLKAGRRKKDFQESSWTQTKQRNMFRRLNYTQVSSSPLYMQ